MTNVPEGSARNDLRERFTAHGIGEERLALHGRLPREQFRMLAEAIDIGLDSIPYNGTTTTCESLWMGAPVVALEGQSSVARSGYALLKAVGLSELCAGDEAGYVRIAVDLANNPERLSELRRGMRARLAASPLRDEAGFTRGIEAAYRAMWRAWCERPAA
jgi:predicted O-linked N-acetylglucosamine transferase (SPINDLY family)